MFINIVIEFVTFYILHILWSFSSWSCSQRWIDFTQVCMKTIPLPSYFNACCIHYMKREERRCVDLSIPLVGPTCVQLRVLSQPQFLISGSCSSVWHFLLKLLTFDVLWESMDVTLYSTNLCVKCIIVIGFVKLIYSVLLPSCNVIIVLLALHVTAKNTNAFWVKLYLLLLKEGFPGNIIIIVIEYVTHLQPIPLFYFSFIRLHFALWITSARLSSVSAIHFSLLYYSSNVEVFLCFSVSWSMCVCICPVLQ